MCPIILCILTALTSYGCGPSSSNEQGARVFFGTIRSEDLQPVADVQVFIFETGESTVSDESGHFELETFEPLNSVRVFFKVQDYTNTLEIGNIPDEALSVQLEFIYQVDSNQMQLSSVRFSESTNEEDMTPTPGMPTDHPSEGSTPSPSPTPANASKFDANGNTSAFGIPSGVQGNISRGKVVWDTVCAECHGTGERQNRTYGQIKAATQNVTAMQDLGLTNREIADVTAYLNRNRR